MNIWKIRINLFKINVHQVEILEKKKGSRFEVLQRFIKIGPQIP